MPAKYSIKRNSLSSKWGVWANGTDASSTVEKLLVELRSNEEAEAYCTRREAGESHDAIIASLTAKKPKKQGGGIFGRFKRRSSDSIAEPAVNNPVIEIETAEKKFEGEQVVKPEEASPAVPEAPSRFQVIEQPKPKPVAVTEPEPVAESEPEPEQVAGPEPEPVAGAQPVAEVKPEPASTTTTEPAAEISEPSTSDSDGERVKMVASPSSLSGKLKAAFSRKDPVEELDDAGSADSAEKLGPEVDEQSYAKPVAEEVMEDAQPADEPLAEREKPVSAAPMAESQPEVKPEPEQPVVEDVREELTPEPAPRPEPTPTEKVEQASAAKGDANSALVDWTFTPPPDVTPAQLLASGMKAPEQAAPEQVEPTPAVAEQAAPEVPVAPTTPKNQPTRTQATQVDPEFTQPAKQKAEKPVASNKADDRNSMTVEIGISKALKDVTIGDPRVPDKKYNKVASQEYTEVSKAFAAGNSPDKLHEELIHLAAVCLAWADAIEKRSASNGQSKAA